MSKTAVLCITQSKLQTERIIERLHSTGFDYADISVMMPESDANHDIGHVKSSKAPEGTVTGAASGGLAGGVLGLLLGVGALAIPGLGAFLAAGPLMATLSGAAVGATTGGVIGGLIGLGIPEFEAKVYEEQLRTGNYLLSVRALDEEQIAQAREIFCSVEARDICTANESALPKNEASVPPEQPNPAP